MDICAEGESAVLALGKQVPHTRPVTAILRKGFLNPGHASSDKGDLVAGLNGELLRHSLHQVLRVWTPECSAAQDANLHLALEVALEPHDRLRGHLWRLLRRRRQCSRRSRRRSHGSIRRLGGRGSGHFHWRRLRWRRLRWCRLRWCRLRWRRLCWRRVCWRRLRCCCRLLRCGFRLGRLIWCWGDFSRRFANWLRFIR